MDSVVQHELLNELPNCADWVNVVMLHDITNDQQIIDDEIHDVLLKIGNADFTGNFNYAKSGLINYSCHKSQVHFSMRLETYQLLQWLMGVEHGPLFVSIKHLCMPTSVETT